MYCLLYVYTFFLIILILLLLRKRCKVYFEHIEFFTPIELFKSNRNKHVHVLSEAHRFMFDSLINDVDRIVQWCLDNKYPNDKDAKRFSKNWKKVSIKETVFGDHVAYVIDKNKKLNLCVTTKDGTNENTNTMRFVVIHELAHMMSKTYGHNDEFYRHFLDILRVAVLLGIYEPTSYASTPVNYCGVDIHNTPCDSFSCTTLSTTTQ